MSTFWQGSARPPRIRLVVACKAIVKSDVAAALVLLCMVDTVFALDNRAPSELAWFRTIDAQINSLAHKPRECLKTPISTDVQLGRLAFNSPRLLGGQAGRMGLNCGSCHQAGRGNHEFFIEQLSDRPGNADISHHFLSSAGGDQVFNPKPIPDLANRLSLKVHNPDSDAFTELLVGLIEVEFDGQPANKAVFESLRSYLRANDIKHCVKPFFEESRSLISDWTLIDDGLSVLQTLKTQGPMSEPLAIANFVASSMRAQLERFYRFYSLEPNDRLDRELTFLSSLLRRDFMQGEEAMTSKGIITLQASKIDEIAMRFAALKQLLLRLESKSYYNKKLATQALMEQQ